MMLWMRMSPTASYIWKFSPQLMQLFGKTGRHVPVWILRIQKHTPFLHGSLLSILYLWIRTWFLSYCSSSLPAWLPPSSLSWWPWTKPLKLYAQQTLPSMSCFGHCVSPSLRKWNKKKSKWIVYFYYCCSDKRSWHKINSWKKVLCFQVRAHHWRGS